jgi:CHAT domain-containing protein
MLYEQGDMKAALDSYQRQLDLARADDDRAGTAAALQGLSLVSGDTAQTKKALEYANQAIEIRRSLGDLRGQAETLFVLGSVHMQAGQNEQSRAENSEALELARRAGDRVREADASNFLAVLDFQVGRWAEAAEGYERALAIDREESEPVRAAQRLSNLGALHINAGDLRKAISYLEQALPIRKTLASPGSYANTLYNLALTRMELGDYQQALEGYNEALSLFRKVNGRTGEGFVLQGLAGLYTALGNETRSEALLNQALPIWRSIPNQRGEAQTLNRLGEMLARRREFPRALALHRQALAIVRAAKYQREEAQTLGLLSSIALRTGDFQTALDQAGKALELSRNLGDRLSESNALHDQGLARAGLGERAAAREAFEHALALRQDAGAKSNEAQTMLELARLDRKDGLLKEASERIAKAIELVESLRANIGGRQSRMEIASSHRDYYDLAIGIRMELHDAAGALEMSERARARGFVDLLREAKLDVREGIDPALLARQKDVQELLNAKHDRFMRMLGGPHNKEREATERKALETLLDRYQAIEAEIRLRSPQYAALTQPRLVSIREIQAGVLDQNSTLIEFWLGESRSYAWVLSKSGCGGFELPARSAIEPLARRVYEAVSSSDSSLVESLLEKQRWRETAAKEFDASVRQLSEMLRAPLKSAVGSRRLLIVTDGALEYVPFAAMPAPSSATPLVASYEIIRLPSASVPAVARAQTARKSSVIVFADPVFQADDARVAKRISAAASNDVRRAAEELGLGDLPRLHFSRQEAEAIATLAPAGRTRIALDFDASVAEVKKTDLTRYRVVHLATHGILNSRHPELSGVVLSMVDRGGHSQDGFLRLHDIYNLKLNADLVVLSACRTALGQEIRSEGLVGLTRGFMYAGASQVLASLWSVRDRTAAEFMRMFYDALLVRHLSPPAALRSAQLAMMKDPKWVRPNDWAAFTVQSVR